MLLILLLSCTGPQGDTGDRDERPGDTAGSTETEGVLDCSSRRWHEGTLRLSRQSEVDDFCEQYNAVTDDLFIDVGAKEDVITELDGMSCLCEVGGDLTIYADSLPEGPPPPHVTGDLELSLLETIGGSFRMQNLAYLTYLQELWSLRDVGGDLIIEGCPDLQHATFFGLVNLGGSLQVRGMDKLLVLRLPSLTTAGGIVLGEAGDSETMYFFTELGIDVLEQVTGDIQITGARNLGRLSAPVLSEVGGQLRIESACSLSPVLPSLQSLGSLHISANCGMQDFSGLSGLSALQGTDHDGYSLWLSGNDQLDKKEVQDFMGGLSEVPGKTFIDLESDCDTLLSAYSDGYCN